MEEKNYTFEEEVQLQRRKALEFGLRVEWYELKEKFYGTVVNVIRETGDAWVLQDQTKTTRKFELSDGRVNSIGVYDARLLEFAKVTVNNQSALFSIKNFDFTTLPFGIFKYAIEGDLQNKKPVFVDDINIGRNSYGYLYTAFPLSDRIDLDFLANEYEETSMSAYLSSLSNKDLISRTIDFGMLIRIKITICSNNSEEAEKKIFALFGSNSERLKLGSKEEKDHTYSFFYHFDTKKEDNESIVELVSMVFDGICVGEQIWPPKCIWIKKKGEDAIPGEDYELVHTVNEDCEEEKLMYSVSYKIFCHDEVICQNVLDLLDEEEAAVFDELAEKCNSNRVMTQLPDFSGLEFDQIAAADS